VAATLKETLLDFSGLDMDLSDNVKEKFLPALTRSTYSLLSSMAVDVEIVRNYDLRK
jgi:hypothetical protein